MVDERRLAQSLGWFSLGLGVAQIAAPRRFASSIGVSPRGQRDAIVRLIGAREVLAAAGLLSGRAVPAFLWMRVAGDLMDLALLNGARRATGTDSDRVEGAMAAAVGVAAVDVVSSVDATLSGSTGRNGTAASHPGVIPVHRAVTIVRPRDEVFSFWRELSNLPRFMRHLEEVRPTGDGRTLWRAKAPAGGTIEWEAETTEVRDSELIAWRSLPGSPVHHAGRVTFRDGPGDRGTEVHVELAYSPPGGPLGAAVARLFREEPNQQIAEDLRHLKQVLETGEVVMSEATYRVSGGRTIRQHPAQPLGDRAKGHPPVTLSPAAPAR